MSNFLQIGQSDPSDPIGGKLRDSLQITRVQPCTGLLAAQSFGGGSVTARKRGGKGRARSKPLPFDLLLTTDENNVTKATVYPGTFASSIVPTNMYADFTISDTGVFLAKIKCLTDGQKITSSTIQIDTDQAPAQSPVANGMPTELYIVFGIVRDKKAYRTLGQAGPSVTSHLLFTTGRTDAAPGELVYDNWYIWKVEL